MSERYDSIGFFFLNQSVVDRSVGGIEAVGSRSHRIGPLM